MKQDLERFWVLESFSSTRQGQDIIKKRIKVRTSQKTERRRSKTLRKTILNFGWVHSVWLVRT